MIGVSKLYCGTLEPSDLLRYGRQSRNLPSHLLQFSEDKKPVVVWNLTRACNLRCRHCYAEATAGPAADELTLEEGLAFLDHLAEYGSPVVLFSGGEPLTHPHILTLIARARARGLRAVLSTNGLLLNEATAARLKELDLSYVGISLDGLEPVHDDFRRCPGAFRKTLDNIRLAREAGLKVGLRLTLTRHNLADLPAIFDLIEREQLPRACFYHLVHSGRGADLAAELPGPAETRAAVNLIADRARRLHREGRPVEILTVDNHADGPYLYLKMKAEGDPRAARVLELLRLNGGNSSGAGIGAVSWNGVVYPDQFWRDQPLGSIREKTFQAIWHDPDHTLLRQLKNKPAHVTGRCRRCFFLSACGGNLRARAQAYSEKIWGEDPACYLTEEEINPANHQDHEVPPCPGRLNVPGV